MNALLCLLGFIAAASAYELYSYPLYSPYYSPYLNSPYLRSPYFDGPHHQYHTQDSLGQYSYGYSGGPSSKAELRTLDGTVRGTYSYIDAYGIKQSANYIADPLGFRVAATNLPVQAPAPVETLDVMLARAAHQEAHDKARMGLVARKRRSLFDTPEVIAKKIEHDAAHARVLAGLPALPTTYEAFPYTSWYDSFYRGVPLDTPAVMAEKARHYAAHIEARSRLAGFSRYWPYAM